MPRALQIVSAGLFFGAASALPTAFPEWQAQMFTPAELADPAVSGPNADPEGDGRRNLLEYALGLDPFGVDAEPVTPQFGSNGFGLTYPEVVGTSDLLYHFSESGDLQYWITPNAPSRTILSDDGELRTVLVWNPSAPAAPKSWFTRLQVFLQPGGQETLLPPSRLSGTLETPFAIRLGWNDHSVIETGYTLEKNSGSGFVPVAEMNADRNIWRDEAVVGSATYSYRVTARQGGNLSAPSNEFTITLPLDSDGDGLSDYLEINTYFTDPFDPDSDNDGMPDGWEVRHGFNPQANGDQNSDADLDGLTNGTEYALGLDPKRRDSDGNGIEDSQEDNDGDGMPNGWEAANGTNPTENDADLDPDSDGLTNAEELEFGTLPFNAYSDGDSVNDGEDGWALESALHPPRLREQNYAVVDLSALGFTRPYALNNKCEILDIYPSIPAAPGATLGRLWKDGQFSQIPPPPQFTSGSGPTYSEYVYAVLSMYNSFRNWQPRLSDLGGVSNTHTETLGSGAFSPDRNKVVSTWSPSTGSQTLVYQAPGFATSSTLPWPSAEFPVSTNQQADKITPHGAVLGFGWGDDDSTAGLNLLPPVERTDLTTRSYRAGLRWAPGSLTAQPVGDIITRVTTAKYSASESTTYSPGTLVYPMDENASGVIVGSGETYASAGLNPSIPSHAVACVDGNVVALSNNASVAQSVNNAAEPVTVGRKGNDVYFWLLRPSGPLEKRLSYFSKASESMIDAIGNGSETYINNRFEVFTGGSGLIQNGAAIDWGEKLPGYSGVSVIQVNNLGCILGRATPIATAQSKFVLLVPIDITFEKVGDNVEIEDNKYPTSWDANGNPNAWSWMTGKGKRIFPDAKTPTDQAARNEVYVKVKGAPEGWKVYLKAFDVDDPTLPAKDPENIVDANDAGGEKGGDNRGAAPVFTSGNATQIECIVGADGFAKIGGDFPKLKVGTQPGDNYRVAVTLLKPDDMSVLQVTDKAANGYVPPENEPAQGFNGGVSPMLTVWRKLHIEQDTMAQVATAGPEQNFINGEITSLSQTASTFVIQLSPFLDTTNRFEDGDIYIGGWKYHVLSNGYQSVAVEDDAQGHLAALLASGNAVGQTFQLFDDDEKLVPPSFRLPLPSSEKLITPKVRSKYYPAYIDIDTDVVNPNTVVPFERNTMAPLSSGKDVPDSIKYWAYRVVAAFQPNESEDIDPDAPPGGELPTLGHCHGGDALIFTEIFRDNFKISLRSPLIETVLKAKRDSIVAHELGHGPSTGWIWINVGLDGWFIDTADHLEGGLMDAVSNEGDIEFFPKTLKRFRSTDRWQK